MTKNKNLILHINALLQKIYSLQQVIYIREEIDKNQQVIQLYNLFFSKIHDCSTDTLVIGITSLFEAKNVRKPQQKTLSVITLLMELTKNFDYMQDSQAWIDKINNYPKKKSLTTMRNKHDRGHLDEELFSSFEKHGSSMTHIEYLLALQDTEAKWKMPYTDEELRSYLQIFEDALNFVAKCYELSIDVIKDGAHQNQSSVKFVRQTNSFFKKLQD